MTMYVDININGIYPVDKISISRIKGKEGEICTYHVLTETLSFFIEHDYNDGAHKLVELVCAEIYKRTKRKSNQEPEYSYGDYLDQGGH